MSLQSILSVRKYITMYVCVYVSAHFYKYACAIYIYVYVITQLRVLCLIYTHDALGCPRASAYISGKARVPVL